MLRTVWAKIESRRRLFLINERCDFIEPVKFYLNHLAHDGRHGTSYPRMEAEKYTVIASNSACVVQGMPADKSLLRSLS